MERFCPHCGSRLPDRPDVFCSDCRRPLVEFAPSRLPEPEEFIPPTINQELWAKDRSKARWRSPILFVAVYAILISTSFDPRADRQLVRDFGEQPLGVSNRVFVISLETLLYLPSFWWFYHAALIAIQARREGLSIGGLVSSLITTWQVGELNPHLRRSRLICLAGFVYFIALVFALMVYRFTMGTQPLPPLNAGH